MSDIRDRTEEARIRYPICPLLLYFEGDKIDPDKCDYDMETRSCFMQCKAKSPRVKTIEVENAK